MVYEAKYYSRATSSARVASSTAGKRRAPDRSSKAGKKKVVKKSKFDLIESYEATSDEDDDESGVEDTDWVHVNFLHNLCVLFLNGG